MSQSQAEGYTTDNNTGNSDVEINDFKDSKYSRPAKETKEIEAVQYQQEKLKSA
jgi:hypothetical protein